MNIILVNKAFLQLANKYLVYLRNINRVGSTKFDKVKLPLAPISRIANHLIYMDFSFCNTIKLDDCCEFADTILNFKRTLR